MVDTQQLQQDLDYVQAAMRRRERPVGVPAIYLFWAVAVLVGFASADFVPWATGAYWFVVGIGGGLLSWWLAVRDGRRRGVCDAELGRRYGLHWTLGGVAYVLTALPLFLHQPVANATAAAPFLLTTGIVYGLAGVHLERPLLWAGLLAFAGYAALVLFALPYAWTITGVLIAICLAVSAVFAARARAAGDAA